MSARKNKAMVIIPVVIIIAAVITWVWYFRNHNNGEVKYSGVVEATTYDLSFEIAGKIKRYFVKEGDRVKKGTLLAALDDETLRAQLHQSQARLQTAQANLDNLIAGSRPQEIKQAQAKLAMAKADLEQLENGPTSHQLDQAYSSMLASEERYKMTENGYRKEDVESAKNSLQSAKSNYEIAKKDYDRYQNLYKIEAVSAQTLDNKRNQFEIAKSNYDNAQENLKKMSTGYREEEKASSYQDYQSLKARYDDLAAGTRYEQIEKSRNDVKYWENQLSLLVEGSRKDDIKAARKKVDEAEAAVEMAKIQLKNSRIFAPADAVVITKNFEEQERTAANVPVISLADIEHPWVYIFIPEPQMNSVKLGQPASISVDSFKDRKFTGKISRIYEKAEYTPKFIQTEQERVNLVFKAKVEVDNPDMALKPGSPADVRIK
ncbi:MAG: efflux RND transporter periplasmic adaptor subunit [Firmicutes bacterium]|nr:efflux RND transporter periplasmic adaptor subunit [Bacillota bacterium]